MYDSDQVYTESKTNPDEHTTVWWGKADQHLILLLFTPVIVASPSGPRAPKESDRAISDRVARVQPLAKSECSRKRIQHDVATELVIDQSTVDPADEPRKLPCVP